MSRFLFGSLLAVLTLSQVVASFDASADRPSANDGGEITAANLLENDVFWPYHVALVRDVSQPSDGRRLSKEAIGVLVRIDEGGIARIDFGRYGRYDVPVEQTDVVARANRVRSGTEFKMGPNFTLSIATKLLDSASPRLRPFPYRAQNDLRGVLCVVADPDAAGFEEMAQALAPLHRMNGVMTVLLPQVEGHDAATRERLRALGWTVPFAFDVFSEGVARALMPADATTPWVILQTNEGRVFYQSSYRPEVAAEVERAIGQHFSEGRVGAQLGRD